MSGVESRDERVWTLTNHATFAASHQSPWGGDFITDGPDLADDESVEVVEKAALEAALRERDEERKRLRESQDEAQRYAERWARVECKPLIEHLEEKLIAAESQLAKLQEALAELVRLKDRQDHIGPARSDRDGMRAVAAEIAEAADAWIAARAALSTPTAEKEEEK